MGRTLYVSNLPTSATVDALAAKFSACGKVIWVKLPTEPATARTKGTAFVEMASPAEAQAAIDALNLSTYDGRLMSVNRMRAVAN